MHPKLVGTLLAYIVLLPCERGLKGYPLSHRTGVSNLLGGVESEFERKTWVRGQETSGYSSGGKRVINFFNRIFGRNHSGCGLFGARAINDYSRQRSEESRRVQLTRQRIRILAEINHLKTLNYDTCQRLTQIESRWVKTSDSLSRRGVSFVREARRILEAIEKRHQNLTMLLELGDEQIQIASKIIDAPMKIETEYCVGTKPELTCVSVATKELPAVVNVIVNCLEQETHSIKDTQILKRQSLSLA